MWGNFLKKSPTPPKNSPKKGIDTLGRKGEHSTSFFYAAKGSFRSTLLQYRLRFLPLSLMDFFEASPYGVLADSADSSSTAVAVPLPLGGRLILTPTVRKQSVGRGFEEVYKRERQEPEAVLQ